MKAVVITSIGGPEVLELQNISKPTIQHERELLVRLKAAGVNPIDTKLRSRGTFYPDRMPAILGCDGAGVVEEVGERVEQFKVGDEVYFCSGGIGAHPGNYAQYAIVDERFAAKKPAMLSFAEAAAAPLVLITAWESLHGRGRLAEGQRVLIHAGAGGVGHVAIQLAKLGGARVATTVSSDEKADFVRELGAEEAILYADTDFAQVIREWTAGNGVDLALDTVGGATFTNTFPVVHLYGDLVTLLQPGADVDWREARMRNLRISLELMLSPMIYGLVEAQHRQAEILAQCAALIDDGKLRIHLGHSFPLEEAAAAHRLLEQGGMTGKIVLLIE